MQKALAAVTEAHKQRTRELKNIIRLERAAFEAQAERERTARDATEKRLRAQIANLEKNRDELRSLLREQREQLCAFRALLAEGDRSGDEPRESEEKKDSPAPMPAPMPESAAKRARVEASSLPPTQLPPGREREEEKKVDEEEEEEEQQEEEHWRVVQIGGPKKRSSAAGGGGGPVGTAFKAVVRGKKRKELPEADDCSLCRQYYDALASETHVPRGALVQQCTRHRSLFPEVSTPEGYWAVGMSPPTK